MWERASLACAIVALGCHGRSSEFHDYREAVCACKDAACVSEVEARFTTTLTRTSSWLDRHLVSRAAEDAMRADLEAAEACTEKIVPPAPRCGGEAGDACPKGFHCVVTSHKADAQGECRRYPQDVIDP